MTWPPCSGLFHTHDARPQALPSPTKLTHTRTHERLHHTRPRWSCARTTNQVQLRIVPCSDAPPLAHAGGCTARPGPRHHQGFKVSCVHAAAHPGSRTRPALHTHHVMCVCGCVCVCVCVGTSIPPPHPPRGVGRQPPCCRPSCVCGGAHWPASSKQPAQHVRQAQAGLSSRTPWHTPEQQPLAAEAAADATTAAAAAAAVAAAAAAGTAALTAQAELVAGASVAAVGVLGALVAGA
jgi:hypothetical protein